MAASARTAHAWVSVWNGLRLRSFHTHGLDVRDWPPEIRDTLYPGAEKYGGDCVAMISLFGLDPATYQPSALHQPDRTFPQTNCYVDLWIELLHARGISARERDGIRVRGGF